MQTTTITTKTVTVKPNIYNDKGCNGTNFCGNYSIIADCLVDLYYGINTSQVLYILDQDGNPIDINRLDKIDILIYNEYECPILSNDKGLIIENMQTTYDGNLLEITPDNFWKMKKNYFDVFNVSVLDNNPELICPDDMKTIMIGDTDSDSITFGQIIFNPITYNGDIFIEITPNESNNGKIICSVNGIPQYMPFGQTNKLLNVISNCSSTVLSLSSFGPGFEQTISLVDKIKLTCTKGTKNKGMFKLLYNGGSIPKFGGNIAAEIILTFAQNDEIEKGATRVISCVNLGKIRQSMITDAVLPDDDDGPIYSGTMIKVVDTLPEASWNTLNNLYLVPSKNAKGENTKIEYVTIKIKNGNSYAYFWEKIGDTYSLSAKKQETDTVINLTNNDDVDDNVAIKYTDNGNQSKIEFDTDGNTITTNITRINGGVL